MTMTKKYIICLDEDKTMHVFKIDNIDSTKRVFFGGEDQHKFPQSHFDKKHTAPYVDGWWKWVLATEKELAVYLLLYTKSKTMAGSI